MTAPLVGACTTVALPTKTSPEEWKLAKAFPSLPRITVMLASAALVASWKSMLAMPFQKAKLPAHTIFSVFVQPEASANQYLTAPLAWPGVGLPHLMAVLSAPYCAGTITDPSA